MTCYCGAPTLPDDHLCAKHRYFQTIFNPPPPQLESKRERALRAIAERRMRVTYRVRMTE